MWPLFLVSGGIVGLSLGLTGGGGAIFAVPLLVYGLGVVPQQAVGVSLVAVGATSAVGFVAQWRQRQVEVRTGLLFALAGMAGAPVGAWLGSRLPDPVLLILFAALMVTVAVRLWQKAGRAGESQSMPSEGNRCDDGPTCRRDAAGRLFLDQRCAFLLLGLGVATGILSGLFGVGGGFVIVPALVLFSGMSIRRAVGTSLMVITLVSASAAVSRLWAGQSFNLPEIGLFVAGGTAGLLLGNQIGQHLPERSLQRFFAATILLVAVFVTLKTVLA
jgi:uncharacterized membrane protein YfcA